MKYVPTIKDLFLLKNCSDNYPYPSEISAILSKINEFYNKLISGIKIDPIELSFLRYLVYYVTTSVDDYSRVSYGDVFISALGESPTYPLIHEEFSTELSSDVQKILSHIKENVTSNCNLTIYGNKIYAGIINLFLIQNVSKELKDVSHSLLCKYYCPTANLLKNLTPKKYEDYIIKNRRTSKNRGEFTTMLRSLPTDDDCNYNECAQKIVSAFCSPCAKTPS